MKLNWFILYIILTANVLASQSADYLPSVGSPPLRFGYTLTAPKICPPPIILYNQSKVVKVTVEKSIKPTPQPEPIKIESKDFLPFFRK
jgi:hypothetical protein